MLSRKPPLLVNYKCRRLPRLLQAGERSRRCFHQPKSAIHTRTLEEEKSEIETLLRQEAQRDKDDVLEPVRKVLGTERTDRLLELCERGNPRKFELAQAVGMSDRQWRSTWAKSRNPFTQSVPT